MSEIEKMYELTTICSQLTDKEIINADGTRNWQANILLDNVKRLEAENAKLKQELAEIGKSWGEIQEMRNANAKLKDDKKLILKNGLIISNMCSNYRKALQEIKEIAENAKRDICNNCGWRDTESCDPKDYTCGEFIKILQKIAESEG